MARTLIVCLMLTAATAAGGCAPLSPWRWGAPPAGNPIFVPVAHPEAAWERTIDVLHEYRFEIERENKLDGIIETRYKTGSGVFEPWHHDSVTAADRLESTLQFIRRRVFVSLTPAEGGHFVAVEAFKERENRRGRGAAGGATFEQHLPLQRELDLVPGRPVPSGWIPLGRDLSLEQELLSRMQTVLSQ